MDDDIEKTLASHHRIRPITVPARSRGHARRKCAGNAHETSRCPVDGEAILDGLLETNSAQRRPVTNPSAARRSLRKAACREAERRTNRSTPLLRTRVRIAEGSCQRAKASRRDSPCSTGFVRDALAFSQPPCPASDRKIGCVNRGPQTLPVGGELGLFAGWTIRYDAWSGECRRPSTYLSSTPSCDMVPVTGLQNAHLLIDGEPVGPRSLADAVAERVIPS